MHFSCLRLVALMTILSLGFVGCRKIDEDLVPTASHGYILAGETGDRIVYFHDTTYSTNLDGSAGLYGTMHWMIDSVGNYELVIGANASTNQFDSYQSAGINSIYSRIQFAIELVQDSLWQCASYNVDSSQGSIVHYNGLNNQPCPASDLSFEGLDSVTMPVRYFRNDRIDANLNWQNTSGSLYSGNSYFVNTGPISQRYDYRYFLWSGRDEAYIGFRIPWATGYRYGYVLARVSGAYISVNGIAMEKAW